MLDERDHQRDPLLRQAQGGPSSESSRAQSHSLLPCHSLLYSGRHSLVAQNPFAVACLGCLSNLRYRTQHHSLLCLAAHRQRHVPRGLQSSMDLFEGNPEAAKAVAPQLAEAAKEEDARAAAARGVVLPTTHEHEQAAEPAAEPAEDDFEMPSERQILDVVRRVEDEAPALRYKVVCVGDHAPYTYTASVAAFMKDIAANSEDCTLCAVHNWWQDIEKFGAIQAHFLSRRHGVRFLVTFHTTGASIEETCPNLS